MPPARMGSVRVPGGPLDLRSQHPPKKANVWPTWPETIRPRSDSTSTCAAASTVALKSSRETAGKPPANERLERSMVEKNILHMVSPTKHISPFDANMALDAGYDAVITYSNVAIDEIIGLVQDCIFSRPPKTGLRSGMFFGGKNATLALDMLAKAR